MLLASVAVVAVLVVLNRCGVRRLAPYLIAGALLWFFMLQSGIHATLAGVILALCIPLGNTEHKHQSPLLHLEEKAASVGRFRRGPHLWLCQCRCIPGRHFPR